ncbi:Ig-like domain-containing protein [Anaeromicropila populeti]|uniref:Ig-like domain (Group 2) n=1 Tax=Anaeromicropila populeti TaxID=37658 RepID=A0A1I6HQU1_9FIRM|nr:Ig-like domain-containing protein [Anaeromicropila populeti]SFR56816.1 Ig-like domain (group 2) [Anaeromicropila populeti]
MKKRLHLLAICFFLMVFAIPSLQAKAAVKPTLNVSKKTITGVGKSYKLKAAAPSNSKITWKSSNTSVASVSKAGVVTAKKRGTVTISCTVKSGSTTKKLTCKITVKVPAKSITFTNAVIDQQYNAHVLTVGTNYDFNAKKISSSSKSSSTDVIRYYIEDTSKATVHKTKGIVTPLSTGITKLIVCAGATEKKAMAATNTVKQEILLYITKPDVSVKNCSLNHGKELAVEFSEAMAASTLLDSNNYLLDSISIRANSNASALGTLKGSLSSDQKTLYISNTNEFKGSYGISLDSTIKSASGYALTAFSKDLTLLDNVRPTYLNCTTDDTGLVVSLNFSEPIDITNLEATSPKKINGSSVTNAALFTTKSNYKLSEDKKSIVLDLSSLYTTDQNTTIEVTFYGITDYADNTTNPYPLIVQLYTNTTPSAQASCQTIYRNGNSLIALFDKSIKTPGYALISGNYISGKVNESNKKQVIYNLMNTNLVNLKGNAEVILSGYSSYNANTPSTNITRYVNFSSAVQLPSVTATTFTTVKDNNASQNVLTLTYSTDITLLTTKGYMNVISSIDGIVSASTPYAFTATASGKQVKLVFTDSFQELGTYTFTLPASFIVDYYNNYSTETTVTAVKTAGDSTPLPGPSNVQIGGTNNEYIYFTFQNMLDTTTAQDKANYSISGLTISSVSLIANNYNAPAIVRLTIASNSITSGVPYQISVSGIKGYKGSFTTMQNYKEMIVLTNNKTLEVKSISGNTAKKQIVITFSTSISTSSKVNFTFTCNNKTLSISNTTISGNTITFTYTDTLSANSVILLNPCIDNYIVDVNNQKLLNTALSVVLGA